jgi:hypothetical protein
LVHGDALCALTTLLELPEFEREYAGKVKVGYLDPPFKHPAIVHALRQLCRASSAEPKRNASIKKTSAVFPADVVRHTAPSWISSISLRPCESASARRFVCP